VVTAQVAAPRAATGMRAGARASWVAALALAASGLLHCWAAFAHGGHGARYVLFFVVAASAQLTLAAMLRRQTHPGTVVAGVAGTVTLIILYVLSRLSPATFSTGHHSEAGLEWLGLATVAAELVTVAALPMLVAGRWRTASFNVALLGGVALWALWLFGFGG
jgi:hypothetical protein